MSAALTYRYSAPCDRCASPTERELTENVYHVLVSELDGEETEEMVLLDDLCLDLAELVRTDLILSFPTKYVCSKECKGLCPVCGKNRNEGDCGCAQGTVDIRLEKLKQLLDK